MQMAKRRKLVQYRRLNKRRQKEDIDFYQTSEYVKPLSDIKIINRKRFDILEQKGRYSCWITGIAAGDDDRIFLCDFNINAARMYSKDMELLSSVIVSETAQDIVLFDDDNEAFVSTSRSVFFSDSRDLSETDKDQMSHIMRKLTQWLVRPATTQISLGIRPVRSVIRLGECQG